MGIFFRVQFSHPFFLFFAALIAGTVNSVAGGGSFISFPALLFTGMPPIPANATNAVAVWPGTLASAVAYRNAFTPDARRLLLPLLLSRLPFGIRSRLSRTRAFLTCFPSIASSHSGPTRYR